LIDNCPTTKGNECCICAENTKLWNSGIEANKEVARSRKRKLSYIANVYVVSDPKHPENEGTIKLFKFGKKIFDKITEAMNPQFADETPINAFDLWTGANFKLKIRKVDGYQNYDKSEFEKPCALFDDDEKLEAIWKAEHSLQELVSDKQFKPNEQLQKRLDKVLGFETTTDTPSDTVQSKTTVEKMKSRPAVSIDESQSSESDDSLGYFRNLANTDD